MRNRGERRCESFMGSRVCGCRQRVQRRDCGSSGHERCFADALGANGPQAAALDEDALDFGHSVAG
jgi:hypothetical protein